MQFNATLFKSYIKDGVAASEDEILLDQESITASNRTTDHFLFGNYVQGENIGAEIMMKYNPFEGLLLEASRTLLKTDWEYQENDDFNPTCYGLTKNRLI